MTEVESLRHRGVLVHIYRALLVPPWVNISAVIDDGENVCLACTWLFNLKPLREALTAAGFQVEVHRTWTFRGLRFGETLRGERAPGE